MKDTHLNERLKKEFQNIASQMEMRLTAAQKYVIDFFLDIDDHLSVRELSAKLKQSGADCAPEDVERALNTLVECGFAKKGDFEGKGTLYEHRHLTEHHDHMVCLKCERIFEFFNPYLENIQDTAAKETGFRALNHRLEIYGLCPECLRRREPVIPLIMVNRHEKVKLKEILGDREIIARLTDMGLTPGVEFDVINNFSDGPVIIMVRDSRLALGRETAHKVMVSLK